MDLVLRGEAQCQAGPGPLVTFQKSSQRWCQRKTSVCGTLYGHGPLSPHSRLCPQPEFQDQVLTWAPRRRPEFTDTGATAQRRRVPTAAEAGQPTSGATQTFHTLLHT